MFKTDQDLRNDQMIQDTLEEQQRNAQRIQDYNARHWAKQRRRQSAATVAGATAPKQARKPSRTACYAISAFVWLMWLGMLYRATVQEDLNSVGPFLLVMSLVLAIPNAIWMRLASALLFAVLGHLPILFVLALVFAEPPGAAMIAVLPILYVAIGYFMMRRDRFAASSSADPSQL